MLNRHGEQYQYIGHGSTDLAIAVDTVAQAFGWKNTKRIWAETRGFKTSVETTIADYPRHAAIKGAELKYALKKLAELPDPDGEVKERIDDELGGRYDDGSWGDATIDKAIEWHGIGKVEDILKRQHDKQAWESVKTAHDVEHIEARKTAKRR